MSYRQGDINDDEIRIISSGEVESENKTRKVLPVILRVVASLLAIVAIGILFFPKENVGDTNIQKEEKTGTVAKGAQVENENEETQSYTEKKDTVIEGIGLSILTPENAKPVLELGNEVLKDSTAILIAQAADIRGDNGKIVGSFVVKGELVSKSEAKAGFCSIINGNVTVGVADATPMFEQSLMTGGYFFRQYPLVVGGQVVENKPKGKSIRKALAETDGKISVIISRDRVTFHDFSKALTDVGVRNAIYLVGGNTYGRYVNSEGVSFTFGEKWDKTIDNVNYIVWR